MKNGPFRAMHAPPPLTGESSTNSANPVPLARSSFSARLSRSYREIRSFGGACSEVVACPRELCCLRLDTAQIVPRGAERERAEPPPYAPSSPPACECGPIPCSHALVRPKRSVFGGAASPRRLGNSRPATRLFPGLHAASVVPECVPSRAAVASARAMPSTPLHRVRKSQGGVWPGRSRALRG